jgi:hypothetical protein
MAAFHRLVDDEQTVAAPLKPGVRPGTRAVMQVQLRNKAIEMGVFSEPKPDPADDPAVAKWKNGARNAWKRGIEGAVEKRLLRVEEEYVWELRADGSGSPRVTSRDDEEDA